ncbi:MAG: PQQ-binding-like beta-propeller repeat protein [Acidobacteriota bacterium]
MSLPISPKWSIPAFLSFGRPALTNGLVLFGQMSGVSAGQPVSGLCRAIRLADGIEVWELPTASDVRGDVLVEGGIAYCSGFFLITPSNRRESFVFAIDALTGVQKWRTYVAEWLGDEIISWNDQLFFHGAKEMPWESNNDIVVVDKATGVIRRVVPIGLGAPALFSLWTNKILVARHDGVAVELWDPATWTATRVFTARAPIRTAILTKDRCYVVDQLDAVDVGKSRVTALHLPAGTEEWTKAFDFNCTTIFAEDKVVAIGMQLGASAEILRLDDVNGNVLWRYAAGNRVPVVQALMGGKLLAQVRQRPVPPGTTLTVALDLRDGRELFRHDHEFSCAWAIDAGGGVAVASHVDEVFALDVSRFWSVTVSSAVHGTPAAQRASVLAGNASGRLTSLAVETGQTRWTKDLPGAIEGGIALSGGRAFVGHAKGVTALMADSGQLVWARETPEAVTSPVQVFSGSVVFGCRDAKVRALAEADGADLWVFQTDGFVEGGVTFDGSAYFVGSAGGTLYALDRTGTLLWSFTAEDGTVDEIKSTPLVSNSIVVVGNAGGHLYALAAADGQLVWQIRLAGSLKTSSARMHASHFWIGDESGHVYRIRLIDGVVEWKVDVRGAVRNTIAWNLGELYVGTATGIVAILDIWTGKLLRSVDVGAPIFASPVITPDAVIVADEHGGVHALVPAV